MAYTAQPTGFLADVVQRIRDYTDEPVDEAKYTTDRLYPLIRGAFERVMNDINGIGENPVVAQFTLTIPTDSHYTYIPPNVGQLLRIGLQSSTTGYVSDWILPRAFLNPAGSGVRLNGNTLYFDPKRTTTPTSSVVLEYIPNGDCSIHLGTFDVGDTGTSASGFRLDTSPSEGEFDRRPNAYLGTIVRLLARASGGDPTGYQYFPIQERIITSYTPTIGLIGVSPDFDFNLSTDTGASGATITYEIVPAVGYFIREAVAWEVASQIRGVAGDQKHAQFCQAQASNQKRLIRMQVANYNARNGQTFEGDVPGLGRFDMSNRM